MDRERESCVPLCSLQVAGSTVLLGFDGVFQDLVTHDFFYHLFVQGFFQFGVHLTFVHAGGVLLYENHNDGNEETGQREDTQLDQGPAAMGLAGRLSPASRPATSMLAHDRL